MGRQPRGGRRGRRKNKEFMDAALDAYIRHLALEKWREVTDLKETLGVSADQAVRDAGSFPERGAYRDIWGRWWQTEVIGVTAGDSSALLGRIEAAVQGALREEISARGERGDAPLEDTPDYKRFLDRALDRLFEEEAGILEDL